MLVVLGATGLFVYLRFGADLDRHAAAVGASTASREEALSDLLQLLLIGGPIALALASLAAYGVAAAALRPVEAMRARAAVISAAEPDDRLPVPPSHDAIARLGNTLNAMLERLGAAIEHERAFVADASHELRTPLAILRTELELALGEGRTVKELRAAIASAAEETDRLTQLSEGLLTIAQTESGELPLHLESVELGEVMEGVRQRFAGRAAEQGREIVSARSPRRVQGDRLRLDQALSSLVDNALRHGEGTIEIGLIELEEGAELHVRDQGPGFPEDFRERAFDRFSRAPGSRPDGGSGLGLAIARMIARAHGGEARLGPADDGSTDVWLTLPVSVASAAR